MKGYPHSAAARVNTSTSAPTAGRAPRKRSRIRIRTRRWLGYCGDVFVDKKKDAYPRRAVPVPAGSTLHIRLYKPQRPDRVQLVEGFDENARSVFGWGRPLDNSLRPVERDGKTVAWDVFFRVKGPDRHYYLGIWVSWERVPGTHISYGDRGWGFHVRTL